MRTTTWLAIATMVLLSACGGGGGGGDVVVQRSEGVVQFDATAETLRLPTLQSGANAYQDVVLRLARDGSWRLESAGALRPMDTGERMDAVLQAPEGTVLAPGWRPTVATITVARLHIGARLYANVPLQFAGSMWFWGQALQAGSDTEDLQEVKALTAADFRANASLAATDSHHTVLHSSPDTGAQRFPLQLRDQRYRFCMDRQPEGADRIRLLDGNGAAVLTLRTGDACAELELSAGRYTMEHEYGGAGAARTLFIRPRADRSALARPPTAAAVAAATNPEYWAVLLEGTADFPGGYLSFNDVQPPQAACNGFIDAAAHAARPSSRPGAGGSQIWLFDTRNLFEVTTDATGARVLGYPLACRLKPGPSGAVGLNGARYLRYYQMSDSLFKDAVPLVMITAAHYDYEEEPVGPVAMDGLTVQPLGDGSFELGAHCASNSCIFNLSAG